MASNPTSLSQVGQDLLDAPPKLSLLIPAWETQQYIRGARVNKALKLFDTLLRRTAGNPTLYGLSGEGLGCVVAIEVSL